MERRSRVPDLTSIERDVLDELCQSRTTRSSVLVAEAMWTRGRLRRDGDPAGLVADTIETLGTYGLVEYRVGTREHDLGSVPTFIRVTRLGFDVAGYPQTVQIGTRAADRAALGPFIDPTDFRPKPDRAEGGEIERMPLAEHMLVYADHAYLHLEQSKEMREMPRGPAIPPEVRRNIVATMDAETVADQAARLRLDPSAVSAIRRRDGDPATKQLRDTILGLLDRHGRYGDTSELLHDIHSESQHWYGVDLHKLQSQLQSMGRLALIQYKVDRRGSVQMLQQIERRRLKNGATAEPAMAPPEPPKPPTAVGSEPAPEPEEPPQSGETIATGSTATVATIVARTVVPEPVKWPVLAELRRKQEDQRIERDRVEKLMDAAEVLQLVEPEEAERLLQRAAEIASSIQLSPEAEEYLRFAAWAGLGGVDR